jgi:hypothetical protein
MMTAKDPTLENHLGLSNNQWQYYSIPLMAIPNAVTGSPPDNSSLTDACIVLDSLPMPQHPTANEKQL